MGLSLLAGCDNEKQQIFTEAEKDLVQELLNRIYDNMVEISAKEGIKK